MSAAVTMVSALEVTRTRYVVSAFQRGLAWTGWPRMVSLGPMKPSTRRSTLAGAAFLMATSAIGPGFLTQTAVFTERLAASFAFAILVSIIVDLVAQLNVWRVLAVA